MKTKFKLMTAAISMGIALSAFADYPPVVTVENQTKSYITFNYEVSHDTVIIENSLQVAPGEKASTDWSNPVDFEFLEGFVSGSGYAKDPNSSCLFEKDQFVNNKSYRLTVFVHGVDPAGFPIMVCKILTSK